MDKFAKWSWNRFKLTVTILDVSLRLSIRCEAASGKIWTDAFNTNDWSQPSSCPCSIEPSVVNSVPSQLRLKVSRLFTHSVSLEWKHPAVYLMLMLHKCRECDYYSLHCITLQKVIFINCNSTPISTQRLGQASGNIPSDLPEARLDAWRDANCVEGWNKPSINRFIIKIPKPLPSNW